MDDVRTRLARCFTAVFPDLPAPSVTAASTETVGAWDSLANATLVSVVEEEFGVEIAVEDLGDLDSFERLEDYVRRALGSR